MILPHSFATYLRTHKNIFLDLGKYKKFNQTGGNKIYKLVYLERETKEELFRIEFKEIYDDDRTKLYLLDNITNDVNEETSCVVITLDKKNKQAHIDTLSSDLRLCLDYVDFEIKNHGTFYLKMTVKMLKKYQDKFGIKEIILQDNATITCHKKSFSISKFLLLTRGESFYGKEGFLYQEKTLNQNYLKIKKIIPTLKMKDFDWKVIFDKSKNSNQKYYNKHLDEIENLKIEFLNQENENYSKIMKSKFNIKNKNQTCHLFFYISPEIELFLINKFQLQFIKENQPMKLKL